MEREVLQDNVVLTVNQSITVNKYLDLIKDEMNKIAHHFGLPNYDEFWASDEGKRQEENIAAIVAQLGERRPCKAEVESSNLSDSTIDNNPV